MLDIRLIERGAGEAGQDQGWIGHRDGRSPGRGFRDPVRDTPDQGVRNRADHRLSRTELGADHGPRRRRRLDRAGARAGAAGRPRRGRTALPDRRGNHRFRGIRRFHAAEIREWRYYRGLSRAAPSAVELLRRGSRRPPEDRRALSEDDRARKIPTLGQPHELQCQADHRRKAGMDRRDLRHPAQGPDRAIA